MEVDAKNIREEIKELKRLIKNVLDIASSNYESRETAELNTALAKAYSEYSPITYNRINPYYKSEYADLEVIMDMVRPILAKNGLVVTQRTLLEVSGTTILQTRLWHSTGQWIESRARIIPSKNDYHTYGSAMSYMKRYQIMAMLNITVTDDIADDDAELQQASSKEIFSKGTALNTKYNPKHESQETITKEQLEELTYELKNYDDLAEDIMDTFRLQSLADMPKSKYMSSMERIRKIINAREGK